MQAIKTITEVLRTRWPIKRETKMKKKTIFFAGNNQQPCVAYYQISLRKSAIPGNPDALVVIHDCSLTNQCTSLNSADIANEIINRILKNELPGIQIRFIRVFCVTQLSDKNHEICVWPIIPHFNVDLKRWVALVTLPLARLFEVTKSEVIPRGAFLAYDCDLVAGDTEVYLNFKEVREADVFEKRMISDVFFSP